MIFITMPIQPPPAPDPGYDVARFLGWFVMLGGLAEYNRCKRKCETFDLDLEEILEKFHDKLIVLTLTKRGQSSDYITFKDSESSDWAEHWSRFYNVNRGHHRHFVPRRRT